MQQSVEGLRASLAQVYWIGGSPGGGKSSTTRILAKRHHTWAYYRDWHELDHINRLQSEPTRNPALSEFLAMSMDERWVLRSPEEMAANTIASWTASMPFVVEDLLALPPDRPVVAEGPTLFPNCVAPLLPSTHHAIWIVPTPAFVRRVRIGRGARGFAATSDPERAMENLIARDVLMADYMSAQARELGFPLIETDGSRTVEELAALVEARFDLPAPAARSLPPANVDRERFAGTYTRPDHSGFKVTYHDGILRLVSIITGAGGSLAPVERTSFRLTGGPYVGEPVIFEPGGDSSVMSMNIGPGRFTHER